MEEETQPTLKPGNKNMFLAVVAVAVIAVGAAGYFFLQSEDDPAVIAEKEGRELVAKVSQLIVLPDDEDPVIATVADPDQLQDTPFFSKAKIGDKVLIYNNARKAILYDPVAHKILEVAPLNLGDPAAQ